MSFSWEKCLKTFQCDEQALKDTEQRYGRSSQRYEFMSQMLAKTLISDRAMVKLINVLMQDELLNDLYRHTSHKCVHLSNSQYMIYVQSQGEDNFGISTVFASYSLNFEQALALIKVYLSWSKNAKHDVAPQCFFDVLMGIQNYEGQLSHNKIWRNTRFERIPTGLTEVRKIVIDAIDTIYAQHGLKIDPIENPSSENPIENALYKIWQILRELYPAELELKQNRDMSEYTAEIFARDLDKLRSLANHAISHIRTKEFEQFENLKDETND